jgi:AraC-like DNA-binding protein
MENMTSFLDIFKQNEKLPIRIVSPKFGHLSKDITHKYGDTQRIAHYFFLFIMEGSATHQVDLTQFEINSNELLFILPNQIHKLSNAKLPSDYYKIGFDDTCLALLPRQYPFLLNPLNNQKIVFTRAAVARLRHIFEILLELLNNMDTEPDLIVAHLNSLLTEINTAYFSNGASPASDKLSKYIEFKIFVENNLTEQPAIKNIAEKLAINPNSLYTLVKHYSGRSPKEFIIHRLILEAKRRFYYGESSSIKELAFELGFNDPEYFSRLFKKVTGKTVGMFFQDSSG